jgi:hypothetical protein
MKRWMVSVGSGQALVGMLFEIKSSMWSKEPLAGTPIDDGKALESFLLDRRRKPD